MRWSLLFWILLCTVGTHGQLLRDTSVQKNWSLHLQATVIPQYHFNFKARYSGTNSLKTSEPVKTSLTSTFYIGRRLWKNAAFYFNPEIAGGEGFSQTLGISGFPNGETFRIGSSNPRLYIARAYLEQKFPLTGTGSLIENDQNQLRAFEPDEYFAIRIGKYSIADFFDDNSLSKDPRNDFMNWSLMSAAAWDYPANTRGYTRGLVLELKKVNWAIRAAINQEPETANGPVLDNRLGKAFGTVLELEKKIDFNPKEKLIFRWGAFYNQANMGNYEEAIQTGLMMRLPPDIVKTRKYSRTKYGYYINAEQQFSWGGAFLRYSWNDGKNETWAFTEIDKSFTTGVSVDGRIWNRKKDKLGFAFIGNGLSTSHLQYLKNGGYGFMIGDGQLNYGTENILECFYAYHLLKLPVYLSPDYQLIIHPAYNKDRGPVHAFALRLHFEW